MWGWSREAEPMPHGCSSCSMPSTGPDSNPRHGVQSCGGAQYDTRGGRVYGGLNDAELLPSSSGRRNSKMRHAGLKSKRGWGCFPSRGFRGDLLAPVQPLGAVFVPRHGAPSPTSGPSGAASVGVCLALALALTSALVTPSPPLTRLSSLPPSDEAPVITWCLLH